MPPTIDRLRPQSKQDFSVPMLDESLRATAREYKQELLEKMFGYRGFSAFASDAAEAKVPGGTNFLGLGYGAKITQGATIAGQFAVRVYVRSKKTATDLPSNESVPEQVNGLPTDVLAIGDITAYARPTACGVSIGHHLVTAGTLGCLVEKIGIEGEYYVLSNNHVLANCNNAALGDPILEPGKLDGGSAFNPIAQLANWEALQFEGPINQIDAAIARVNQPSDVTPDILSIGPIAQPTMPATLYQSVRKTGRTTEHTVGMILDLSADVPALYGTQQAYFEDQLAIHGVGGPFSLRGDSGSVIVDAITRRPVALLFAGGNGVTFATPIDTVLSALQIRII